MARAHTSTLRVASLAYSYLVHWHWKVWACLGPPLLAGIPAYFDQYTLAHCAATSHLAPTLAVSTHTNPSKPAQRCPNVPLNGARKHHPFYL